MSERLRDQLREEVTADLELVALGLPASSRQPFVDSAAADIEWDRSWHFFACAYGHAFDVLWDGAYGRRSGPLDYPLLFVARHSIELWVKAALWSMLQEAPPPSHKLGDLWRDLMVAWKDHLGRAVDDTYTDSVHRTIRILDTHDHAGDRFRYPTSKAGRTYESTDADLVDLYKAHSIITGFCDAVVTQMQVERDFQADLVSIS